MSDRACYCCRASGCRLVTHSSSDWPDAFWFVCKVCEDAGPRVGSTWQDSGGGRIVRFRVQCPLHPKAEGEET